MKNRKNDHDLNVHYSTSTFPKCLDEWEWLACWLMKVLGVIFCFRIFVNGGALAGYQNELTFKHSDGSYSAFGEKDDSGNTW